MKKKIIIFLITLTSILPCFASISETVNDLYQIALNKDSGYLSAKNSLNDAIDNLEEDPLYYQSTLSINSQIDNESSLSSLSSLSIDVPILDQLTISTNIDTNLDGGLSFTYSPLNESQSNINQEINLENANVYIEEYKENLLLNITQAYIKYLISIEKLNNQKEIAALDKAIYDENVSLFKLDEISLSEVQDSLLDYNSSTLLISDYELEKYTNKIQIIELIGIENSQDIIIEHSDLDEIINLCNDLDSVLNEKDFSYTNTFEVTKALNETISIQDSYDSLKTYDPTFNISCNLSTSSDISATISFKTSYDDYNKDEKDSLLKDLEVSKALASKEIYKIQDTIDILEKTIESDKLKISNIKDQIEENNDILYDAYSLLELDEYEQLDYQSLLLNSNNLKLSLIEAYSTLYNDQLTLINYL